MLEFVALLAHPVTTPMHDHQTQRDEQGNAKVFTGGAKGSRDQVFQCQHGDQRTQAHQCGGGTKLKPALKGSTAGNVDASIHSNSLQVMTMWAMIERAGAGRNSNIPVPAFGLKSGQPMPDPA